MLDEIVGIVSLFIRLYFVWYVYENSLSYFEFSETASLKQIEIKKNHIPTIEPTQRVRRQKHLTLNDTVRGAAPGWVIFFFLTHVHKFNNKHTCWSFIVFTLTHHHCHIISRRVCLLLHTGSSLSFKSGRFATDAACFKRKTYWLSNTSPWSVHWGIKGKLLRP